jgi:hypothetical protein
MYFAIKLNSDKKEHARAAQAAALVYAEMIEEKVPELAADLRTAVMQLRHHGESTLWRGRCQMTPLPDLYQRALYLISNALTRASNMREAASAALRGDVETIAVFEKDVETEEA